MSNRINSAMHFMYTTKTAFRASFTCSVRPKTAKRKKTQHFCHRTLHFSVPFCLFLLLSVGGVTGDGSSGWTTWFDRFDKWLVEGIPKLFFVCLSLKRFFKVAEFEKNVTRCYLDNKVTHWTIWYFAAVRSRQNWFPAQAWWGHGSKQPSKSPWLLYIKNTKHAPKVFQEHGSPHEV